mmetsp:Transcript_44444/g.43110  ORF Transcript_44444/g.43110 Transcript_44444/m.43110 type:complete len:111 (-) Transcript_44444:421-753(-)|eukprot:CAMPEP_0170554290 /NCGR_PEP_ID=MMETSP0211-20121228/12151_1 /TAXON_ID=311385 /ORGANISM="Pseudokeronopsis sp., Strain OXSARD2" /LENGTH=110 /DNA_ID=CAMNT_0010863239 /DNA_START=77 /DNA_END=409 /DNA_ORIENTATION=-
MYPTWVPSPGPSKATRAALLIRDPIAQYKSLFQFACSSTQNKNIKNSIPKDFLAEFKAGFEASIKIYKNVYTFWMQVIKDKKYPVYFLRYEDFCSNCEESLTDAFRFYMG